MEPKDSVQTENFKSITNWCRECSETPVPCLGYTNTSCEFFPCHRGVKPEEFNCLFCYCPLAFLECPGPYKVLTNKDGTKRKDCSNCTLPHKGITKSWDFIQLWMKYPRPWAGGEQTREARLDTIEINNLRIRSCDTTPRTTR